MVHVCCVCNQVKGENGWYHGRLPINQLASHGYCPQCAAAARLELDIFRFQMNYLQEIDALATGEAA